MPSAVPANAIFALISAVLWGGADFSGGMGVKYAGGGVGAAIRVVLIGHSISLVVLCLLAGRFGGSFPGGAALAWGLGAGVAGAVSLCTFYMALSRGGMGASAAISGMLTAAIPAAVSIYTEGSPGTMRLAGFAVAGAAIWMIAAAPTNPMEAGKESNAATTGLAIFSGVGFGIYFVALKMAGTAGLLWPMAAVRIGSAGTCLLMLGATALIVPGERVRFPRRAMLWSMGPALFDTSGNLLFMAATRAGRLDVASVLAALYPASTILLAAWVLRERPTRQQGIGMVIAAAAVVMITV